MTDYGQWSKEQLLKRVQDLESKLDQAANGHSVALQDTVARMRAILETAVEGIVTIDERGIIESLNPAVERLFGYSAAEVIGQNVSILMPSPYREEHDQYMQNYRATGKAKVIGIGREV